MFSLFVAGGLAFLLCLVLTPLWRNLLQRLGLVDINSRQVSSLGVIPRTGGLVVLAAAALGLMVPLLLRTELASQSALTWPLLRHLAAPVLLIVVTGLIDDFFGLSPRMKLAAEAAAALLVFHGGIRITSVFGHPVPVLTSGLVTVVWLLACTNAFNLLDGLDGLAAGVALFATGTVLVNSLLSGGGTPALITVAITGALAGFLFYNFPPASIFLGDAGSLSIGFLLGCFALLWADKATTFLGLTAPLLVLVVPLFDTTMAIVRRWIAGRPVFAGDHGHVHHRLVDLGFAPKKALLMLYGAAGVAAIGGLLLANFQQRHLSGLAIVLLLPLAWLAVQQLRYAEFDAAGRVLGGGLRDQRKLVGVQLELNRLLRQLDGAEDYSSLWSTLGEIAEALHFSKLALRLGPEAAPSWKGERLLDESRRQESASWSLRIPLGEAGAEAGEILLQHDLGLPGLPIADLARTLHEHVSLRLQAMGASRSAAAAKGGA